MMIGSSFGFIHLEFALLVAFAFAVNVSGAVLGAGGRAPWHGQPGGVGRGHPGSGRGCGGCAEFGEE